MAILEPTDTGGLSNDIQFYHQEPHYSQHQPSPIDATASRNSFESFATLRSLLDRGDVYTATYNHWSRELEDDFAVHCSTYREGRCATCHGQVFTEVTEMGERLTVETREVKICTLCKHGICSGGKLRLVTKHWEAKDVGSEESGGVEGRMFGLRGDKYCAGRFAQGPKG